MARFLLISAGAVFLVVLLAVVIVLSGSSPAPMPSKPSPAPMVAPVASTKEEDDRFKKCRANLEMARKNRLLHDLEWAPPKDPRVVVGPAFVISSIDVKEALAVTIDCFLMAGRSGRSIGFDVVHWQTGRRIGRYSGFRLEMD